MNFQMFKLDLEKAEEPEIKLPTSFESQKKQGTFRKTSTSASLTTLKPDYVDHNHLICLLRNLYAGQETTVRTAHGTTDWFKMGQRAQQG